MIKNNRLSELKEKEKDARRKIIVDAAEKEFATKPFIRVNMRDIAKRACISPALIYRHFPDQQSLFFEAYLRGVSKVFDGIYGKIDASADGLINKMKIKDNVRFHSHTLFAALIGTIATFRNHPDKTDGEVLNHRNRIALNLARLLSDFASHQ